MTTDFLEDILASRQFELELTVTGARGMMALDVLQSPDRRERTQIGCG